MPEYGILGPYRIFWKLADNKESIHVHLYKKKMEVGKIWLSITRNSIIVQYAPKDIDKEEVAKIILVEPTYTQIKKDWLAARNNIPFTYIDARKYNNGEYVTIPMNVLENLAANSHH